MGQPLTLYKQLMTEAPTRSYRWNGLVNDSMVMHAYHLVVRHAFEKLENMQTELRNLLDSTAGQYATMLNVFFIVSIVLALLASYVMARYDVTVRQMCAGAMLFLRRCSPIGIVTNTPLLNYLLNQDASGTAGMTTTGQIIHSAKDAIVCTSPSGVIDLVNQAVQQLLGFIPEQLLGQNIKVMISEKHAPEIQKRLDMMVRHECPKQFKDTFELLNDSDEPVTCLVDIMGLTGNEGGKAIEAFVCIIRDVSSLIEQQNAAEIAKQKSEKLLYEILPRDIVNRINQGEKDITFIVPSATLMFIDIQKFSAYAADLTPQEIMGNLSLIFGGFDALLPKYSLITKIKLIGDVYMCGAGLFVPDEEPKKHADQMVRFALEALSALEDVNMKLNATLSVRIGVNTGGPIIAGVLGTDKPVFDIIGDPINIAARLQSTCLPNRVQISEDTYHLLRDMDFTIEPRGEIFLKGKGNRPAFLVVPATILPFAMSDLTAMTK
jgi:PAS domain S-box-containing protein